MASSSNAASSSSLALAAETRPDAGPLPAKVGEIGYTGDVDDQQRQVTPADGASLPERHPADREHSSPLATDSAAPSTEPTTDASSTHSKRSISSFLSSKNLPRYGGVSLANILLLTLQTIILAGTIAGWVMASKFMSKASDSSDDSGDNQSNGGSMSFSSGGATIFVHVAFAVVSLAQLLLLERRIFRIRIQRYMHLHPGEVLPTSLSRITLSRSALPLAPWQRAPIPTYAATLAADGIGTGDVEDSEIARPPPPVYGATRGSMLLLAGFMRESLRAQAREHEIDRRSHMSTRSDRPASFVSRDEDWEERRDAERARTVEETLARLEDGRGASDSR